MPETRAAHPYFLYDAIVAQPQLIEQVFAKSRATIDRAVNAAAQRRRIVFIGIGTSLNAANIAERWMRHHSAGRALARAEQSFEFAHYPLALGAEDAAVIITHTGTTTQSVEALRLAKSMGALTIAVTGYNPGEGILGADFRIETCEQEVAFAYTKSYTTALAAIGSLVLGFLEKRGFLKDGAAARAALEKVPGVMREALETEAQIRDFAPLFAERQRIVFFGAGTNWATASEAALKIKETSYLATEGFETEEILHGPFSEIDDRDAMVALLAGDAADDRARTILRAAKELGMLRAAITNPAGNRDLAAEHVVAVPDAPSWLAPFTHVVPLQLLTYHIALARNLNPDTGRQDQEPHARAHRVYKL